VRARQRARRLRAPERGRERAIRVARPRGGGGQLLSLGAGQYLVFVVPLDGRDVGKAGLTTLPGGLLEEVLRHIETQSENEASSTQRQRIAAAAPLTGESG
jgi:hypothetical protein